MALRLIAHDDKPDTTSTDGCARVWLDEADGADGATVLVQLYEAPAGLDQIAPARVPSGELLGRLPVETLLQAADAVRARR